MELLTGKTASARGAEKIKNAVGLVDDTLGINTVDTIKNVVENGVVGGILGTLGQKAKNHQNVKASLDITKRILSPNETVSRSHEWQTDTTPDDDKSMEAIRKMQDLLEAGVLTQEEFDSKKKELLAKL